MLPLLIPLLSLFVGISNAEEATKFTEVVEVRFIAKMNPASNWTDNTIYDPPDPNHILSQPFENQQDSAVGSMRFLGPNDKKSARLFTWSPNDRPVGKNCSIWLTDEPEAKSLWYDLEGDTFGPTLRDTKFLKVSCSDQKPPPPPVPPAGDTGSADGQEPVNEEELSVGGLKEDIFITFLAEPANLIDTVGQWWIDTTTYAEGAWEILSEEDNKQLGEGNSEKQFKLGTMKFGVQSPMDRTYTWEPKPEDGIAPVIKQCTVHLDKAQDPGVTEVYIWAKSLTLEPRRDGQPLDQAATDKFKADSMISVNCALDRRRHSTQVEDEITVHLD